MAKKKKNDDDQRSTGTRVPIQLLVDYKTNGHYLFDFCRDLGTGGVFIETDKPQEQGSTLDLTFTIPDSKETLIAKGQVIWVQQAVADKNIAPGMGIQFEEFSQEQRDILENFIKRYHGESFGTSESEKPA